MKQFIALMLALTLPLAGADTAWDQVKTVRPGERVWINYMKGDKLKRSKGKMVAWTEDSLAVRLGKSTVVLARNDVSKVAVYGGKSRGKGAGYGLLAGAAVGAGVYGAVAATGDGLDVSPAAIIAGGALLIAGVGAVIGLAVGATKTVTIYEAPAGVRDANVDDRPAREPESE